MSSEAYVYIGLYSKQLHRWSFTVTWGGWHEWRDLTCTCVHVCMRACNMYACMYVCMYVCMEESSSGVNRRIFSMYAVCMCMHVRIYTYIHACVCMYVGLSYDQLTCMKSWLLSCRQGRYKKVHTRRGSSDLCTHVRMYTYIHIHNTVGEASP